MQLFTNVSLSAPLIYIPSTNQYMVQPLLQPSQPVLYTNFTNNRNISLNGLNIISLHNNNSNKNLIVSKNVFGDESIHSLHQNKSQHTPNDNTCKDKITNPFHINTDETQRVHSNEHIKPIPSHHKHTQKKKKSKRGRKKIDRTSYLNSKGRYQCSLCCRSYKRFNDLKGHHKIHESDNKGCPYCGKKFSRPIYLNDHIRSHTGEKPFCCNICAKKFKAKRNLTQHRKIHFKQQKEKNNNGYWSSL